MSTRTISVFLASSDELKNDRNSFGDLIRSLDNIYEPRGIRIKLQKWEDFFAYCTGTRTQDQYNQVLSGSDMCICLFHKRAGQYTLEEFHHAMAEYQRTGDHPKTYVYARALVEGEIEEEELKQFKDELFKQMGHYWCNYATEDSMKLHFVMQFEHLLNGDAAQSNLKVDGGSVMLHGRKIADYANLPFASENSEMKILIEKISSLDKEVAELRALNIENLRPTINTKLTERNECQKQLDQLKKQLLDMALFISKIISSSNPIGERKRLAIEMFETGNNKGILDVLNEADIASERERAKAELAYGKQLVKTGKEMIAAAEQKIRSLVEELIMKAKTWMRTFSEPNRFEKACKCYERAIQYTRESLHSMDLAKLLYEYASFLQDNNQFDGVNDYYQEALDLRKQEGLVSEDDREYEADILNRMAAEFVARGRFEDAEQLYLQSIQIREGLVCWTKLGVATTYNNLGCLYREIRQYNKAEDCFQSALRIYDQRRYDYDFILSKANTLKNLCTLYVQIDRLDDAENAMLKALAILEENKRLSDEDSIGQYAGFLGYTGWLYRQKKQLDKAEKYLLDSWNAYQPLANKYPEKYQLYIASLQDELGVVCRMIKRYEEAEKYHRNALDCYEKLYEIDSDVYNKDLARVLCHLAILYAENNNMEAEKLFLRSIQLYEKLTPESMPDLAFVVHNLACFYYEAKQWNEAKVNFQRAVEMYDVLVQSVSDVYEKSLAGNLCNLGATYEKLDSLINAETYYLRALEINERLASQWPDVYASNVQMVQRNLQILKEKNQGTPKTTLSFWERLKRLFT